MTLLTLQIINFVLLLHLLFFMVYFSEELPVMTIYKLNIIMWYWSFLQYSITLKFNLGLILRTQAHGSQIICQTITSTVFNPVIITSLLLSRTLKLCHQGSIILSTSVFFQAHNRTSCSALIIITFNWFSSAAFQSLLHSFKHWHGHIPHNNNSLYIGINFCIS